MQRGPKASKKLTAKEELAILLKVYGLQDKEIATALRISPEAVKSRFVSARSRVHKSSIETIIYIQGMVAGMTIARNFQQQTGGVIEKQFIEDVYSIIGGSGLLLDEDTNKTPN